MQIKALNILFVCMLSYLYACFKLCSGRSFGAANREAANCHMLCEQDPSWSSNKLHDDEEGAFASGLCFREVMTLHLGEQDHWYMQFLHEFKWLLMQIKALNILFVCIL